MKFSTFGLKHAALVAGFGLLTIARLSAGTEGSLTDLDIEYTELKVTLEKILAENKLLRDTLSENQKTLAEMRQSFAATSAEAEVFKRQSTELKLRMEALGLDLAGVNNGKLEQRLLNAVSDLRATTVEKKVLSEALARLADAAADFARTVTSANVAARTALESEIRNANRSLGSPAEATIEALAVSPTITDGIAISVKPELSLVVLNLGRRQGVKVGMPFRVLRGQTLIGKVQIVDIREKFSGAIIQNLSSEREQIQVGDRLVVDAKP